MYQNICIDSNNLFWRSVATSIRTQMDKETDVVYTLAILSALERINQIINTYGYKDSKIYLCFDNPVSVYDVRRLISHDRYKHTRENKNIPSQLYHTLDIFEELCSSYSNYFHTVKSEKLEADDLTIILKRKLPEETFLFVSADMDWARNIDDKCNWFNFKKLYTKDSFRKEHSFDPDGNKIKIHKAIHGDSSDCIPNAVPYLPKDILLKIVNESDKISDIYNIDMPEKWKDRVMEAKEQIEENYCLVDFVDIGLQYEDVVVKSIENIPKLKKWFNILDLPLETRMLTKEDDFFTVKKQRRLKF